MSSKKTLLLLLVPVTIVMALAVAYLLKDYVSEFIITPLWYTFRIAKVIYEALPQLLWWGVFLFILLFIAVKNLLQHLKSGSKPSAAPREERLSRAQAWSRWIELSEKGDYSRWLLARRIARLTHDVIAHQERLTLGQVEEGLRAGHLDLPFEVQAYIQVGLDAPSFRHYSELLDLLRYSRSASPLDLDPELIVEILEARFQIGGS